MRIGLFLAGLVVLLSPPSVAAQGPVRNFFHRHLPAVGPTTCDPATGLCGPAVAPPVPMAAENVAAASRTPLFYDLVRLHVARELERKGVSKADAHAAVRSLTNPVVDGAMTQVKTPVGAFGDGTILQKILDFLASPQGQALIAILLKLLMGG